MEQFAGDQYNVITTGTGPVPQATAALPAPPAHLVGRTSEAAQLLELLDPEGQGPSAVVVSAVSGLGGSARPRWRCMSPTRRRSYATGTPAACCS